MRERVAESRHHGVALYFYHTGKADRAIKQGIQYLRFLVLVLSTFGIGIGIGIESIPGLVNGIDPIVNWY